ncbi:hypothetical protein [Enterococcus rivorum]|uniref:hypothetical protein n=1 Tax=Enterococcus rivorum TaxID=762845 RepID=UPI003625CE79
MLTIQFSENKRFPKKAVTIYEGIKLLYSEEQRIMAAKSSESVKIMIKGSTVIDEFSASIPLGKGYGQELISYVEQELLSNYPDNQNEIDQFVEELATSFADGRNGSPMPDNNVKEKKAKSTWNSKTVLVIFLIAFITVMGGILWFTFAGREFSKKVTPPAQTVTSQSAGEKQNDPSKKIVAALEKKSAIEVGNKFPEDHVLIVEYLVEKKKFKDLETFQDSFPTEEGAFNLAFYQEDWENVIKLQTTKLTKEYQAMLAHAYIKLRQPMEAEILNETLKSDTLKKEILETYKVNAVYKSERGKLTMPKPSKIRSKILI